MSEPIAPAPQTALIRSRSNAFTTVRDPFAKDAFIAENYQPCDGQDVRKSFSDFLQTRSLLFRVMTVLRQIHGANPIVPILDIGAFTGRFGIAAALEAERAGNDYVLTAFEANPTLLSGIRANIALYGLRGRVIGQAVGGKIGKQDFASWPDRPGAGMLTLPQRAMIAGETRVTCETVPLYDLLSPEDGPALVAMDIRGGEPAAFSSIAGNTPRMNNIFILPFGPQHAGVKVKGQPFGQFLTAHFRVFDIGNWLYQPGIVRAVASLERVNRISDLLLVPPTMGGLCARLADTKTHDA